MSEELKACPFCGGEAKTTSWEIPFGRKYRVECKECFVTGDWEITEEKVVNAWNVRQK